MKHPLCFEIQTPLGPISFLGTQEGLESIQFKALTQKPSRNLPDWAKQTQTYFHNLLNGKLKTQKEFEIPLIQTHLTSFQLKVYHQLLQTKIGEKLSYKELGQLCQSPLGARAVGTCMSKNKFPLIIPCHRVLPQSGKIGNYSAANGSKTKQNLLDIESNLANTHRHTMAMPYCVKFLTKSR